MLRGVKTMKNFLLATLAGILFISGTSTVMAHHSAAPFDFSNKVTIEGIVKEIKIINPHSVFVLEVTDDKRGTRDIEFEGMSASVFYRSGFIPSSAEVGDKIQVTIAPRRDGEDGGFVSSMVSEDGKWYGFGSPE
jgi:hypothetical protein